MKKQMIKISSLLFVMVAMMLSACDDYLDDVPKWAEDSEDMGRL